MANKNTPDRTKAGGKTAFCKKCPYDYTHCPYSGYYGSHQLVVCPFAKQCNQIEEHKKIVDVDQEFKGFKLDNWIKDRLN